MTDKGPMIHLLDKPEDCAHDFQGWREFRCEGGGGGGETVCTKCGMGAMHYTLMKGD